MSPYANGFAIPLANFGILRLRKVLCQPDQWSTVTFFLRSWGGYRFLYLHPIQRKQLSFEYTTGTDHTELNEQHRLLLSNIVQKSVNLPEQDQQRGLSHRGRSDRDFLFTESTPSAYSSSACSKEDSQACASSTMLSTMESDSESGEKG